VRVTSLAAAMLGARVDEEQLARPQLAPSRREVQHRAVVAGGDDRLEREEVTARAKERRLERDLQLAFRPAGLDQRDKLREARPGRLGGNAHALELDVILRPPGVDERVAERAVGVGCGAQPAHRPSAYPRFQLVQRPRPLRHALAVALEP
jgi:hypothetical protein